MNRLHVTVLLFLVVVGMVVSFRQPTQRFTLSNTALSLFKGLMPKAPTNEVEVEFLPADVRVNAIVGQPLSEVAEAAGVEILYKCLKGECGTCQVNVNGKWIKACQTVVPSVSRGENFKVTLRPVKKAAVVEEKKKPAFFSPKSLADGFANNVMGMVGFVQVGAKVDDEFQLRMEREKALADKVAAKKAANKE
jgi:ferredoxin